MTTSARRAAACACLAAVALALTPPASAAEPCADLVRGLRADAARAQSAVRNRLKTPEDARDAVVGSFTRAMQERPDCRDDLLQLAASLQSSAGAPQPEPSVWDQPLGPVGWLWLSIYEDIFRRSPILMVLFGWQLFLAPLLLVASAVGVLKGGLAGLHRPERTEAGVLDE